MRIHELNRPPKHYRDTITFYSGGARCRLSREGDAFYLDKVYTAEADRGNGDARAAVEQALAFVDQHHAVVSLVAMPFDGTDRDRLIGFYEKLGFRISDGDVMVRPAQA